MKFPTTFLAVLWLLLAGYGMWYLAQYKNTPAANVTDYPKTFPAESRIERSSEVSTLLFFSHPKCPCTRASLRELSRLLSDLNGKLHVVVIFIKPQDSPEDWKDTDLIRSAEAIPNVRVLIDENERETKIFNAQTSGLNLLYDREGNLKFDGGITSARGHEGDNAGRQAIYEIVTESPNRNAETAVFGCPLNKNNCSGEKMPNAEQFQFKDGFSGKRARRKTRRPALRQTPAENIPPNRPNVCRFDVGAMGCRRDCRADNFSAHLDRAEQ